LPPRQIRFGTTAFKCYNAEMKYIVYLEKSLYLASAEVEVEAESVEEAKELAREMADGGGVHWSVSCDKHEQIDAHAEER
jgi:hypothetical protein